MAASTAPILVPLDGSKTAEQILPLAAAAARAYEAPIRLIHAAGEAEGVTRPEDVAAAAQRFEAYAREAAARHGVTLNEGGVETISGKASQVILEAARDARLLAIATHGRGGFHATFIGSVADKVIRGAHVPLLVAPGHETASLGPGPVVVTLDGSEEGERALPEAREAARRLGREVVLLRAFSLLPPVTIDVAYYPPTYLEELEEAARAYLESVKQPGERTQLVTGPTAESIVTGANELGASLIVMASGGKGLAKRLALGSVTDRVLHTARRPLLIVPPPAES